MCRVNQNRYTIMPFISLAVKDHCKVYQKNLKMRNLFDLDDDEARTIDISKCFMEVKAQTEVHSR